MMTERGVQHRVAKFCCALLILTVGLVGCGGSRPKAISTQGPVAPSTLADSRKPTLPSDPVPTGPSPTPLKPTYLATAVPTSLRPLPDGPLADALRGVTLKINGDPAPKTIGPYSLPPGSKQQGSAAIGESGLVLRYDLARGMVIVVSLRLIDRSMPMTATILDVLEVRLSSNEELDGDCQLDKKFANYSVLGLIVLGTAGDHPARQGWQVNTDSGQIAPVEPGRVTCYVHSEPL
jgi:hypothetical protein